MGGAIPEQVCNTGRELRELEEARLGRVPPLVSVSSSCFKFLSWLTLHNETCKSRSPSHVQAALGQQQGSRLEHSSSCMFKVIRCSRKPESRVLMTANPSGILLHVFILFSHFSGPFRHWLKILGLWLTVLIQPGEEWMWPSLYAKEFLPFLSFQEYVSLLVRCRLIQTVAACALYKWISFMQVTRREILHSSLTSQLIKELIKGTEDTNLLIFFLKLKVFVLLFPIVRQVNILLFLIVPQFQVFIKCTVYLLLDFDMLIIRSVWSHNSNDVQQYHTAHICIKCCQSDRQPEPRLCSAAEQSVYRCVLLCVIKSRGLVKAKKICRIQPLNSMTSPHLEHA